MRGAIGTPGRAVSARLPFRPSLLELAYRKNPEPLKRTDIPPQAGAGMRLAKTRAKFPDEVILEVRRLREQKGVMPSEIAAIMQGKGLDVRLTDIDRYLSYRTRGALVPEPNAKPYI